MAKSKLSPGLPQKKVQKVAQGVGKKGSRQVNFSSDNLKGKGGK